jgi:hypothetical protein
VAPPIELSERVQPNSSSQYGSAICTTDRAEKERLSAKKPRTTMVQDRDAVRIRGGAWCSSVAEQGRGGYAQASSRQTRNSHASHEAR